MRKAHRIWISAGTVSNLSEAVESYVEVLGLQIQLDVREDNQAGPGVSAHFGKIALHVPPVQDRCQPGGEEGIIFHVENMHNLRQRLSTKT